MDKKEKGRVKGKRLKAKGIKTEPGSSNEQEGKKKPWHCLRCGKCCKFIIIPVRDEIDMETEGYLLARGMAYDGKKLIIPAVCQYLKKGDLRGEHGEYYCSIHSEKFANCRLAGEKECKEAQKAWSLLYPKS